MIRFQAKHGGDLVRMSGKRPVWTGKVALAERRLRLPLTWRAPKRIFVASLADPFHEDVPDEWLDSMLAVMIESPRHTYQLLTKRPERMRDYLAQFVCTGWYVESRTRKSRDPRDGHKHFLLSEKGAWPLPNLWLGTSVEDQATADERIPVLLETPAPVRFISAEPLLGPIDLSELREGPLHTRRALFGWRYDRVSGRAVPSTRLDWLIVGGESGPHARLCDLAWIESLVEQCRRAAVPCFVKQLGAAPGRQGSEGFTRLRAEGKEGDPDRWPPWLRVREFPGDDGRAAA